MSNSANVHDIQAFPAQLRHEIDDVFAGVLPLVERGDLGGAFAAAGALKGVQTFDLSKLPAGARYVPFDNDEGLVEVPSYVTDESLDPPTRAKKIAQNVGSISLEPDAPGIVRIHAPDGGVHKLITLEPDTLVNWLGTKGYTAPPAILEGPVIGPAKQAEFDPPTELEMQPVAVRAVKAEVDAEATEAKTAEAASEAARQATDFEPMKREPHTPSPIEQVQSMRRMLGRASPRLATHYNLEPWEVEHARRQLWDGSMHYQIFDPDLWATNQNYPEFDEGAKTFDEITTRVVRAAYSEVVRTAPKESDYVQGLRSAPVGAVLANHEILAHISDAEEARRSHGLLTLLGPAPTPSRRVAAEQTSQLSVRQILAGLDQYQPAPRSIKEIAGRGVALARRTWNTISTTLPGTRRRKLARV